MGAGRINGTVTAAARIGWLRPASSSDGVGSGSVGVAPLWQGPRQTQVCDEPWFG